MFWVTLVWFLKIIMLVLVALIIIHLPDLLDENRKGKEKLKKMGCHCPRGFLGHLRISPECPVHSRECTVIHKRNWYGGGYVIYPHSDVERVMLCQECFDRLSEEEMEMFYYRSVGECGVCNKKNQLCIRVPANLVKDWVAGETFHFSWGKKT